jgi:hypothetical protein
MLGRARQKYPIFVSWSARLLLLFICSVRMLCASCFLLRELKNKKTKTTKHEHGAQSTSTKHEHKAKSNDKKTGLCSCAFALPSHLQLKNLFWNNLCVSPFISIESSK